MKKIFNNKKADTIVVYNALDIASGGSLSLIKQSIAQSFQGFLEAKFNNLIEDIVSGGVSEEELLKFVNSHIPKDEDIVSKIIFQDKEFISNIILKNMHADNRITTFLLAKLWIQKMKNGSLNYYESSLFTNISTLTFDDFKILYDEYPNLKTNGNQNNSFCLKTSEKNTYYATLISKYESIGIFSLSGAVWDQFSIENGHLSIYIQKNDYSEIFFNYLKEYFERD